ncbi:MAG: ImmA/IrrE family metallo-endopeptidase [Victivallales bacterium]|nr:ImmA/IrrE family metallo-endopeptidase [Victivallales bacterium]
MAEALINPQILQWARKRMEAGGDEPLDDLLKYNKKYHDWESGNAKPTFSQAQELAKKLCIPFGYLYLTEPPKREKLVADLRTIRDYQAHEFSVDLQEVIERAISKQDWYREELENTGISPLSFIEKYTVSSPVKSIAADITKTLGLSLSARSGNTSEQFLSYLTEKAEDAGILVLRDSRVANSNKRKLKIEEFRGFALSDPFAPLIFINSSDFVAAQIFTFVHELAHLWIGQDGVSNFALQSAIIQNQIEKKCNQIAAEVLVPEDEFIRCWNMYTGNLEFHVDELRKFFKTSTIVLARRALDMQMVSSWEFSDYYNKMVRIWKSAQKRRKDSKSGPSPYTMLAFNNGHTLTEAVCSAVYSGKMMLRDGAYLLGVKPFFLDKYNSKKREMF